MQAPDLELLQDRAPTATDQQTAAYYDDEKKSLENERLRAQIADLNQDRDLREKYGERLFRLVVWWLIVIGLIVVLHGISAVPFELSATVLATLIGSTTASVLGLFAIVANYLFPKR